MGAIAGCLTNLAQDEKQVLLATQSSQERTLPERIEFMRSYLEPLDKFMVVAKLVPNVSLFSDAVVANCCSTGFIRLFMAPIKA